MNKMEDIYTGDFLRKKREVNADGSRKRFGLQTGWPSDTCIFGFQIKHFIQITKIDIPIRLKQNVEIKEKDIEEHGVS